MGTHRLPRSMRSFPTGYPGAFHRHHHRVGHLFQKWQIQSIRVPRDLDCDIGTEHLTGTKSAKVQMRIVSRTPSWSSW